MAIQTFTETAQGISALIIGGRIGIEVRGDTPRLDDLVDATVLVDKQIRKLEAYKARLVDLGRRQNQIESRGLSTELQTRSLMAELGAALQLSDQAAGNLIAASQTLVETLPATLDALQSGRVSYRHAQVMTDECSGLSDEDAAALEQAVLAKAQHATPPRLRRVAKDLRERRHPESIAERHAAAREERAVFVEPGRDGMGWLTAHLPNAQIAAIHDRLTTAALTSRGVRAEGDDRTLAQRRADIFLTVFLGTPLPGEVTPGCVPPEDDSQAFARWFRGIRAQVVVTVPVLTLLGRGNEPATIEGFGPVDGEAACILSARAPSFLRVLTHPETGVVLSVGRKRYKVPKDLRAWLRVRDGTCRFVGCGRSAMRCDVDHTEEWHERGETSHINLAHLCRFHHTLKSTGAWGVRQSTDGRGALTWTSPTGRSYVTHPAVEMGAAQV
ncbi:MAG: endonuclease [Glaciihabitans sp.]|nr:endonuclease [Glaciihabitans sp.]